MEIPVSWLSYCDENPSRGRWDQAYTARLIAGEEWVPPNAFRFVDTLWDPDDGRGRLVVFPCGHYAEHGEEHTARWKLTRDLDKMPWAVIIATSDECQTFQWHRIDPWPEHVQLWVMLPRPDHTYPPGTRFIGEGSPATARQITHAAIYVPRGDEGEQRDLGLCFIGQGGHERREQALAAMRSTVNVGDFERHIRRTAGFTQGLAHHDYLAMLARTWFAPAPSGICSQSSFRFYEALEAGCIPLVDGLRPGGEGAGFWSMLGLDKVTTVVDEWRDLPAILGSQHPRRVEIAGGVSSRWQQYKRRLAHQLHRDVRNAGDAGRLRWRSDEPDDQVTVIVPTSPVPSNPSMNHIVETVDSIRRRLPSAEILITCDGVRDEQVDRAADYHEFVRRLCGWTNQHHNVCPIVFNEHQHQSGMMRRVLDEVGTTFVLYVEHDCPLEGDIPFDSLMHTMLADELASMRLFHEVGIQEGSEHLFFDLVPGEPGLNRAPYIETLQWSQRPHLAMTDWYRRIMGRYFGAESRTMIEDVMHGVVQYGLPPYREWQTSDKAYAWRIRAAERLGDWRMGVYAPEGSWKRSGHLDARGGDPKFPMLVAYDDERPGDAPPEGWMG